MYNRGSKISTKISVYKKTLIPKFENIVIVGVWPIIFAI